MPVAVHDAVERVQKMFFDRLVRRVPDVLLGDRADARGEVDQLAILFVRAGVNFFF